MWRPSFLLVFLLIGCTQKSIEGLVTRSYAGGQQQEGKVAYSDNPPLGGAYSPMWQKCGAYTAPLYDEYAVHSLERGAVWVTYSPALPAAEVAKLRTLLAGVSSWLLSPREGLPGPLVVSVWNAQVQASGPEDTRVQAFLDRYAQPLNADQSTKKTKANTAPEVERGCAEGYVGTQ